MASYPSTRDKFFSIETEPELAQYYSLPNNNNNINKVRKIIKTIKSIVLNVMCSPLPFNNSSLTLTCLFLCVTSLATLGN